MQNDTVVMLTGAASVLLHIILFVISSIIIKVWFLEPSGDPLVIILVLIRAIIPYAVLSVIILITTFFLKRRFKIKNFKEKYAIARISLIVQLVTFVLIMAIGIFNPFSASFLFSF